MAISVKINNDFDLESRIHQLADRKHRSVQVMLQEAIRIYVEREEARESFKQEALDAWASYQHTGMHLTLQETRKWLSQWGDNENIEVPKCHK